MIAKRPMTMFALQTVGRPYGALDIPHPPCYGHRLLGRSS